MSLHEHEVAYVVREVSPWDVTCPTCKQPPYIECDDRYNRDHALDGHPLRWAVAGASALDEVR